VFSTSRCCLRTGVGLLLAVVPAVGFAQQSASPRLSMEPPPAAIAPLPGTIPSGAAPSASRGGGGLEDLAIPQPQQQQQPAFQPAGAAPVQIGAPQAPGRSAEDEAFESAVKQLVPLTPDQITEFRKRQDAARRAQNLPIAPVRPVTRTISLSLKPGETTPVIRVTAQRVTTLTFVDITGKPWPVLSVATGDPTSLEAKSAGPQNETNIITLSPIRYQGATNVAVTLTKYPVPIVMTVTTGQEEVDYRVDVRVGARGPNAIADMIGGGGLAPTNDTTMMSFLDGVPPRGAEKVSTGSRDVEAWMYDKMMYVRTTSDTGLLSPAFISKSSGNAGVNVYQMLEAPVLIVSREGRMSTVSVRR
jgi:intracellular multiplication protein IcmK